MVTDCSCCGKDITRFENESVFVICSKCNRATAKGRLKGGKLKMKDMLLIEN